MDWSDCRFGKISKKLHRFKKYIHKGLGDRLKITIANFYWNELVWLYTSYESEHFRCTISFNLYNNIVKWILIVSLL